MQKKLIKGFSLVEILISLAIIGIVASISIPYIRTAISNITLTNTAKEIVTDLRDAQQLTVGEQTPYYAQFIEETDKYQIIKESNGVIIKEKIMPSELEIYSINGLTDNKVKFNYFGASIESGTIILLNTNTNITSTIEIKPSGYVSYN